MRTLLSLTALIAAGACATSAQTSLTSANDGRTNPDLERLYAVYLSEEGLRVRAETNGCTDEDSFDVNVEPDGAAGDARYAVTFVRVRPDRCAGSANPNGANLFYPRAEIGLPAGADVAVLNPIGRDRPRL